MSEPPLYIPVQEIQVLVVDDDIAFRKMIAAKLKILGYKVLQAVNGSDAIDKVLTNAVNIIIMDVNMPVMNGPDATRQIRVMGWGTNQVPIIGFSSDDDTECKLECLNAGMNTLISKCSGLDVLADAIKHFWLESRSAGNFTVADRNYTF